MGKKKGTKKYKPSYGTGFPGRWKNSQKWLSNDLDVLMGKAVVTQVEYIQILPIQWKTMCLKFGGFWIVDSYSPKKLLCHIFSRNRFP